ncbi:MAG: hypothetical protein WAX77_09340 [Methylococcaceae bacterium]
MKADDALSQGDGGWGGAREKRWHETGKRAVVSVDAQAYELVTTLAKMCLRPNKDLCSQIFAVGLEALTGYTIEQLCDRKFTVEMKAIRQRTKAFTLEDVKARAALLQMMPEDDE